MIVDNNEKQGNRQNDYEEDTDYYYSNALKQNIKQGIKIFFNLYRRCFQQT